MHSCHLLTLARNVANAIPCTSSQHSLVDCGGNHYYQATKSHWLCLCTAHSCTNGHHPCMTDVAVLDSYMSRLTRPGWGVVQGPLFFTPFTIQHSYLRSFGSEGRYTHWLPGEPAQVHDVKDAEIHQYRRGDCGMNDFIACTSCSACIGSMASIHIGCMCM